MILSFTFCLFLFNFISLCNDGQKEEIKKEQKEVLSLTRKGRRLLIGGLALRHLGTDGLRLGGAVLLGGQALLLDVRQVRTNDGALHLHGAGGAAAGHAVCRRLAVDAAVRARPLDEAWVLLAHVQPEALRARERQHGLRRQEREGHVAAAVAGVHREVGELALNRTHDCY